MAHSKSALKRIRQNKTRKLKNNSIKSRVKTFMKKIDYAIRNKKLEESQKYLKQFCSSIDKAIKLNIYHKNNVARKKSKMMKKVYLFENSLKSGG